ncbi:MAG: 4Fe-4S cluster-binding domain-containing protein [Promethearchaeota archaeon]|nr:MAG: 4Fe-4S cluster-binding domain-containing protein [Candidatus Lokiarchaeota archaeon]
MLELKYYIMLKGIHFLLTYSCNFECDHCFLYCSPNSAGTFTLKQINNVLNEAEKIKTVEWIYFEGGEPFLFYPLMIEGLKIAGEKGFKTGVVTNSYWATNVEDAELWLKPLADCKISDLSISDDFYHFEDERNNLAKNAKIAAKNLNLPLSSITIEEPSIEQQKDKGTPVIGGGAMFRGRAVEKLIKGLPLRSWDSLSECPYEDLNDPERVHIDSFGNVHLCQGLILGNMWKTPLSELIINYDYNSHPICRPLIEGGPAELVRTCNLNLKNKYVDECHLCYLCRLALIERFPQYIAPKQVYGL